MPDFVAQARAGGLPLCLIVALKGAELAASWGGRDTSSAVVLRSLLEDRDRALQQCEARGLELLLPVCNASEADGALGLLGHCYLQDFVVVFLGRPELGGAPRSDWTLSSLPLRRPAQIER